MPQRRLIQGITFETAAWNGVDDTKTFWVENYHQQCTNTGIPTNLPDCATAPPPHQPARSKYELPPPFTMGASHGSVFDDTVFIGRKHAHAVAIETHTNNSEILWMNSHFTDAFRGVTVSNANALNNIVYNGTFERNDEMIGPGGGGDYSVFGATVDGGICPSLLTGGSIYVYGLDDSGGAGCTSYIYAPGGSWNVMVGSLYENSTLAWRDGRSRRASTQAHRRLSGAARFPRRGGWHGGQQRSITLADCSKHEGRAAP